MLRTSLCFFVLLATAVAVSKRGRHHRESTTSPSTLTPISSGVNDSSTPSPVELLDQMVASQNPCLGQFCGAGRECRLDVSGSPVCECRHSCPPPPRRHRRTGGVCGTDGRRYLSHCLLHRAACLRGQPVAVDRNDACLQQTPDNGAVGADPGLQYNSVSAVPSHDGCSLQQYEVMKDNLLLYNHAKLMSEDKRSSGKEYLVSIMFSHYDQNNDGALEIEELDKMDGSRGPGRCGVAHMVAFDDADGDGRLDINEFYMAFSKLYSVSVVSLDKALQTRQVSVLSGSSVELRCAVSGSPPPPIVWRRHGADLSQLSPADGVRVFSDGSLYLSKVQLVHAGNYTCHAQRNSDVVQTHVLHVYTTPEVKVTPKIQSRRPGEDATMFCHVVGEPFPKVEWLKNEEPLQLDEATGKFDSVGNGSELRVRHIAYADTGAYMCRAQGRGGAVTDISSLVVQDEPTPSFSYSWMQMTIAAPKEERRFFAFHDGGVSVYEPTACRLYHQIQATDVIPGTQQYVCGGKGESCSWGGAVNVANRYVYAAQPRHGRVLVISKIQMVVVDVVVTDHYPVELHYVPHLDQVWVLNWRGEHNRGSKTIQVIRDASQKRKHHTVHPQPIDGQFDLVSGLFVPPVQDLNQQFKYGYASHGGQRGLYKLDLASMRYIKAVDLSEQDCLPKHLQFSSLYGLVVVECEDPVSGAGSGQLVLDYLTDAVVSRKAGLMGRPHVSPDSRVVVTLHTDRDGVVLVVQTVQDGALKFSFDVKTTLNISDIAFFPSLATHGYDLYASATDKEDILFLNLSSGQVEVITGVGRAMDARQARWGAPNRPLASPGVFGHFLVTAASDALFVLNGSTRTVNCEVGGVSRARQLVWVTMHLQ